MGNPIPLDPRRYGNIIARLQQSSSEAVRFALQAEMNAEALEQQEEMFAGQLQALEAKERKSKDPGPDPTESKKTDQGEAPAKQGPAGRGPKQ